MTATSWHSLLVVASNITEAQAGSRNQNNQSSVAGLAGEASPAWASRGRPFVDTTFEPETDLAGVDSFLAFGRAGGAGFTSAFHNLHAQAPAAKRNTTNPPPQNSAWARRVNCN